MKFSSTLPIVALATAVSAGADDTCVAPPPSACGWGPKCSWETSAEWGCITRIWPTSTATYDTKTGWGAKPTAGWPGTPGVYACPVGGCDSGNKIVYVTAVSPGSSSGSSSGGKGVVYGGNGGSSGDSSGGSEPSPGGYGGGKTSPGGSSGGYDGHDDSSKDNDNNDQKGNYSGGQVWSDDPYYGEAGDGSSPGQEDPNGAMGHATATLGVGDYGNQPKPTSDLDPNDKPKGNSTGPVPTDVVKPNNPHGPDNRGAWLDGFSVNSDYEQSWPTTGDTKRYVFTVSNQTMAPDGVPKQMLVINGQYPGPTIEANWGDFIEVTVVNDLQNNGTGIHWHGFRQFRTNDQDGVNGVTECPIAPGESKTYRFQATAYGSSWYHSHFSSQYGDGVVGPIVIHGPASANYDIDLGPVFITDLYPLSIFQEDWLAHHQGPPLASNIAFNGKNAGADGNGGERMQWNFTPGKKHLLRFINGAVDGIFKLQLDGHKFTIIANDFVPIVPYVTDEITISVGQRYDVIVEADQSTDNYFLRAIAARECMRCENDGTGSANAIIHYDGCVKGLPENRFVTASTSCFDETITNLVPVVIKPVDQGGFASQFKALPININRVALQNGENVFQWYLNGISQNIDWVHPTLGQVVNGGGANFANEANAIVLNQADVWTYWVIQNQFFVPHPMHLHGHDFALLGQGSGQFNPDQHMSLLNFDTPARRDVAMLISQGWTVIAFKTDNPGAWLMHCHIAWHASEGLSLQFVERPNDMASMYASAVASSSYSDTCASWKRYFDGPVAYNKTDSGLKRRTGEHFDVVRHLQHSRRQHRRQVFS